MVGMYSFIFDNRDIHITFDSMGMAWFQAKEIAEVLGYRDANSMTRRLMDDEKDTSTWRTLGGDQEILTISEKGLNRIIMRGSSKRPEVIAFQDKVFGEILPSIRMGGGYLSPELIAQLKQNPEYITEVITRCEELEKQVKSMQPKVEYYDRVIDRNETIAMHHLAKLLYNNVEENIGRNRLMQMMRIDGFLLGDNTPSQYSIDCGLMVLVRDDEGRLSSKITPQGEAYFLSIYSNVPYEAIDDYLYQRELERVARQHQMINALGLINHTYQIYGPFNDPISNVFKRQLALAGHQVGRVSLFRNLTSKEQEQRAQDPLYRQLKDLGIAS